MRRRLLLVPLLLALVLAVAAPQPSASANGPRSRVSGQLLVRHRVGGPGSACAEGARACLVGTAIGDLSGEVRLDVFEARSRTGSARTVDATTVDLTVNAEDGRLDGIGVALLYAANRDQRTRVEWIGGTGVYAEAVGAVTLTGSALPVDATGLQLFHYRGMLAPRR